MLEYKNNKSDFDSYNENLPIAPFAKKKGSQVAKNTGRPDKMAQFTVLNSQSLWQPYVRTLWLCNVHADGAAGQAEQHFEHDAHMAMVYTLLYFDTSPIFFVCFMSSL